MSTEPAAERSSIDRRLARSRAGLGLESLAVLAGRLAHDFNELLVGVLGNAALARGKLAEDDDAYSNVADIESAALRAKTLVGLLAQFAGESVGAFGVARVADAVHAAASELDLAGELDLQLDDDVGEVSGAARQLRHLASVLIDNALEASDGADAVRVLLREAEVSSSELIVGASGRPLPAGRYVELLVADDGCGMDAACREKAFEPFFSTRVGARGLGLAVAQRIVATHRGSIQLESEPGRGTSVRVLLPVRRSAPETVAAPRRRLVLVVDDEEGVRRVARGLLEAAGYDVLTASDGLEAVDLFRAHLDDIDVVLLDWSMPRVGGEATFRALRRERDDVRVLLTSGRAMDDDTQRLFSEGVAGFLPKPFTGETLLAALSGVFA